MAIYTLRNKNNNLPMKQVEKIRYGEMQGRAQPGLKILSGKKMSTMVKKEYRPNKTIL